MPNFAGRYAPSPSGDLHFGNLRTALLAWLFARNSGRQFFMRVEDIDSQRCSPESAERQLEDLAAIGLEWDEPVLYQSTRSAAYEDALAHLDTYECFCSRKEIREAASAPHAQPGMYPGTCRDLTEEQRAYRRSQRTPAIRLRSHAEEWTISDFYHGEFTGPVDDVVLRRDDWGYNLAVVVDDGYQGIDQIVRGGDLLASAPTQAYIAHELGLSEPEYVHVPLVVNADGQRLAKRDGAVTLREMLETKSLPEIIDDLATSIGYPGVRQASQLLDVFDPRNLPAQPYVFDLT